MAIDTSNILAEPKAYCRVCYEPIQQKAIKCTKCASYQDWTRHLARWSALLISLFALAPLWDISQSLKQLTVTEKKMAKIEAVLTRCDFYEVRVAYENSGKINGIVTGARFALIKDGTRSVPELEIRLSSEEKDIVVSPGERPVRAAYKAYIDNNETNFISESSQARPCTYQMEFEWMDFSGTKKQLQRECSCP